MMSKEFTKYKLPKNWVWTTIGELGIVASGGTPSTKERRYWNGDIPWITPADLTDYKEKHISSGRRFITEDGLEESSAKLLPKGTILFSSRAPIGYVAIAKNKIASNQGFKNLIPTKSLFSDYIFYYLKFSKQTAENMSSGTTFLELSAKNFSKIPIPVPPISEQKRMVKKLEEILSELEKGEEILIQAREQINIYKLSLLKSAFSGKLTQEWRLENKNIQTVDVLLRSIKNARKEYYESQVKKWKNEIFDWERNKKSRKPRKPRPCKSLPKLTKEELKAFEEFIPSTWTKEKLVNISYLITDGKHGDCRNQDNSGYYFISAKDVYDGKIQYANARQIVKADFDEVHSRTNLEPSDVVITNSGTIGRVAIAEEKEISERTTFQKSVAIIKKPHELINSKYLAFHLQNEVSKIKSISKGTAQKNLLLSTLSELEVTIVPLKEQLEIVKILESKFSFSESLLRDINYALDISSSLYQSILKNVFSGKLTNQDSEEKSVSQWINDIKEEKRKYFEQQKMQKSYKPKKNKKMNKPLSIEDVLKASNQPISAKEVWEKSNHKDDIEAFYAELKKLKGKVKEVKKGMLTLTNAS